MIDSTPNIPVPDIAKAEKNLLESFRGMSIDDALHKIASSLIDFSFKLVIAVAVLYIGKIVIRKLYKTVKNIMHRRDVDPSLCTFILSLIKIVLYFILIITVIGILGIETSSFLALFASAGVAIGMALSGTLQNFAGGVLILLLKPYKVGDYIEAQGYSGVVKAIQIFHTVINTPDNKAIIIPNGGLSTSSINNFSLETYRRVEWTIGLAYGIDCEQAIEKMLQLLSTDSRILTNMEIPGRGDCTPFVGLNQLADSSINFTVRAWTKSADYWGVYFDMNKVFYTELPKFGFDFPFPQMDVHLTKE